MKIFGIGLSRTGTTSMSIATLELGFKTAHGCFDEVMYDIGNAFFDTPVWADYPLLDQRYPGSKFILTWRNPARWYASFSTHLGEYLKKLRTAPHENLSAIDRRAYLQVFTEEDNINEAFILSRYYLHRQQAEYYFRHRPDDLLILDLDVGNDSWELLCGFLNCARPSMPFPRVNSSGMIFDWKKVQHPNKINEWLDDRWISWTRNGLNRGANPKEILDILLQNQFDLTSIRQAMGDQFPVHE